MVLKVFIFIILCVSFHAPLLAGKSQMALVTRVIDTGRLTVEIGGQAVEIRLIGIAAVEDDRGDLSESLRRKLWRRWVMLEGDDLLTSDSEGRRFVYLFASPDGEFVNLSILCNGQARFARRPDLTYADDLERCERRARSEGRGIWSRRPEDQRWETRYESVRAIGVLNPMKEGSASRKAADRQTGATESTRAASPSSGANGSKPATARKPPARRTKAVPAKKP
jgi:endonuclease YncB( thermonuclease family)